MCNDFLDPLRLMLIGNFSLSGIQPTIVYGAFPVFPPCGQWSLFGKPIGFIG